MFPRPCPHVQLQDLQTQLSSARASGSAINLQIPAGNFNVNQSLLLDLTTALQPVGVTITGQGVGSTVLDCQGRNLTAILVKNASSTVLSDLTVQNCGNDIPGACSASHTRCVLRQSRMQVGGPVLAAYHGAPGKPKHEAIQPVLYSYAGLGGGGVHLETTGDITVTRCVYRGEAPCASVHNSPSHLHGQQAILHTLLCALSLQMRAHTWSHAGNGASRNQAVVDGAGIRLSSPLSSTTAINNVQITDCSFIGNVGRVSPLTALMERALPLRPVCL